MNGEALLDWSDYIKLFAGLLSLADPISSLPLLMTFTQHHSRQEKAQVIRSSVLTFIITLFIFTFIGTHILGFFGISIAALKVAGGILFLFYGLEMLGVIRLPHSTNKSADKNANDSDGTLEKESNPVGIVPIGIPSLAGPGTITKVVIYADMQDALLHKVIIMTAIVAVGLLTYLLFRTLVIFGKGLNKTMMTILTKVMGLILTGISAEFILEGVVEFLAV